MKKIVFSAFFALFAANPLWATITHVTSRFNCTICNNLKGHIQEFVPIVKTEIVYLTNGTAIFQIITDSTKLEKFHTISESIDESLKVMKTLTNRGVKNKLCSLCQRMYRLIKTEARISRGQTADGDLTVFVSDNQLNKSEIESVHIGFLFWDDLTENAFLPSFDGPARFKGERKLE